jgi:hypothetical protein
VSALALAIALAAGTEILLPPWPLSPDGELVGVRGGAELAVEGGHAEPVASGLFRVVPAAGVREVRLGAGAARAVAPVEPPAGTIAIAAAPVSPVKGRDAGVALELTVLDAEGAPDPAALPPVISASSGRVRDLAPAGPGRFAAVYEPSSARFPEVAALIALSPRCPACASPRAVGYAILPVAAAIDLPGASEPGARTTVEVGGRRFGPATADARGRFSVPVVVPPGARIARATSIDPLGNRRETRIDLGLPPVDRIACTAWPVAIPADGASEAQVYCVASEAGGAPAPRARLSLAGPGGAAIPIAPWRAALQRAVFRAPRGGGGREARLAASYPDGGAASKDEVAVRLATGAPARFDLALPEWPAPEGVPAEATLRVLDARGDALGNATPPGAGAGPGGAFRLVPRRQGGAWEERVPAAFALPPAPGAEVAALSLVRAGDRWRATARTVDGRPAAGVPLAFGSGATAVTDERGEAAVPATGPAETATAPGGARAAGWEGLVPPAAPVALSAELAVPLRPAGEVNVRVRVEGGAVTWTVLEGDASAPGRPVRVLAGGSGLQLGPPERTAEGGRTRVRGGRGTVTVVDEATGVSAAAEVP